MGQGLRGNQNFDRHVSSQVSPSVHGVAQRVVEVLIKHAGCVGRYFALPFRSLAPATYQAAGRCARCGAGVHHVDYTPNRRGGVEAESSILNSSTPVAWSTFRLAPTPAVTYSVTTAHTVNSPRGATSLSPRLQGLPSCSKKNNATFPSSSYGLVLGCLPRHPVL